MPGAAPSVRDFRHSPTGGIRFSHMPMIRARSALRHFVAFGVLLALCIAVSAPAVAATVPIDERENPMWRLRNGLPLEYEDDAPMPPAATGLQTTRVASTIVFGPYTSIQVNVNTFGNDVVNDAANEPSLAVSPFDHNQMVVGWRQFNNIGSNFREAGFGYSSNGGATWATGKIQAGTFRSDPVLAVDSNGDIFYNSLAQTLITNVFPSTTGGSSWGGAVYSYGGDKQWMVIDPQLDNFYQAWSTASNPFAPNTFNKSINDGASFTAPSQIPDAPIWGTLDVDLDNNLYLVGWATSGGQFTNIAVSKSINAKNQDASVPTFTTTPVNLGGFLNTGGPNPAGLLGQLWIAVDKSNGPRRGWVYVLSSVQTPTDPMDVHFIRSTDGGQTWSTPKRVNDDPAGNTRKFQWFGTMSVAPNGRIDAVWNDTRGSADSTISALYYSYSADGGTTWSPNVQVTPTWSSVIGWPNQQKIGDYYDTSSDDTGVDVAYAATFNGGQDVYYLRIPNSLVGVGPSQNSAPLRLENSPNPFAGRTTIRFDAPTTGANVRVEVFDLAGHRVATLVDGFRIGPDQTVQWDGRRHDGTQASPGVYMVRVNAAGVTDGRKILRVR